MLRKADRNNWQVFKDSFDLFRTCSFWITEVKGNSIVSTSFVKAEDTSIHRKGTHLFIHMSHFQVFTFVVI